MRIFGLDIRLGASVDKENQAIQKQLTELQDYYFSFRPTLELMQTLGTEGVRIPWFPLPMKTLYDLAMYSDIVRNIIHALKTELFRRGLKIDEKFVVKCMDCGKEYMHKHEGPCDVCGSTNFKEPDVNQKYRLENFIKNVNDNGQSLLDVCRMINDDLEIVDDGYMIVLKDYIWDEEGNVVGSVPVEVLRGHPMFMNIIADKTGRPGRDEQGQPVYTCLVHRQNLWHGEERKTCPQCGRKLYQAYFKGTGMDGKSVYYIKGEVYHRSKYMQSLTYGFSPLLAVWQKCVTLINQDKYIKDYYTRQRPPRGLLFVSTPNIASLEKSWNWMLDMWKKNPHMIPPIGIEQPATGRASPRTFVEFIDFMRSLDEMQFIEAREEFRRTIGAVYGVMPLFSGEAATGVRNEGLQIVVTTRAIENGQEVYNSGFFPFLLEQLGITDYELKLVKPEYRDEMTIEQIRAQKIANAQAMKELGFGVVLNEEGEFEFTQPGATPPASPTPTGTNLPATITPPEPQRFAGEPTHLHPSTAQRFAGEPVDVHREVKKQMEEDYRYYLSRYGDSAQAVGWESEEDQLNRFSVVSENFEEKNPEIMDVGAGLGHFYEYLVEEGFTPIYEGIDIVPEFVERARAKGINVRQMDVINLDRSYDYIVALGTFAFTKEDLKKIPDPWEYTKERIKVMFEKAKKMVIVTLLVKPPHPEYVVFSPEQIEEFARSLTSDYEIWTHEDDERISPDEVILNLFKEVGKGDAPVTTTIQSVYFPRYSPKRRREQVKAIFVGKMAELDKKKAKEKMLTKQDEEELEHIANNLYEKPFAGLSKRISDKIKDYLLDAYQKGKVLDTIINAVKRIVGKRLTPEESETIARTEIGALENKAREWSYSKLDPEGEMKYKWIGPMDSRLCDACKEVIEKSKKGLKLEELKELIRSVGKKYGLDVSRDWVLHPNDRCTLVRV